jgi:hypothetical protein
MAESDRVPRITRREILRKGAIVGGTLVWATPVVQSLAPAANAFHGRYSACCECKSSFPQCAQNHLTFEECASFCGGADKVQAYLVGDFACIRGRCVPA